MDDVNPFFKPKITFFFSSKLNRSQTKGYIGTALYISQRQKVEAQTSLTRTYTFVPAKY